MSGQLAPAPIFQAFAPDGSFLVGGLLTTYAAGTTTPQATYTDFTLGTPNTNPIVLNAYGQAQVWLSPTLAYKFVLTDAAGNLLWTVDNINAPALTQAVIGAILYPQTAQELAAGVTPTNYAYPAGDVRRYGADPTGVADSTSGINQALSANDRVYLTGGTYVCSSPLLPIANQTFYGDGPTSILQFATGPLTNIYINAVNGVTVRALKILVQAGGTGVSVGGVRLFNASHCIIEQVEMSGCNAAGVWLDGSSSYNTISNCYFHNFRDTAGLYGDVWLYNINGTTTTAPYYNVIDGNYCFGGGGYGVAVVDPYAATTAAGYPQRNMVTNNRIGAHLGYGILLYMPGNGAGAADTFNSFIGNWIENISGTVATNTSSGAGIYLASLGIGGAVVSNNTIFNCCTGTLIRNLAPGGIGINGAPLGITRPIVSDNAISGMSQGDGICLTSSPGGAVISNNSINMPSTNNGTGPGTAQMLGAGIRIEASSLVSLGPNDVQVYGTGAALYGYANGVNNTDININGGNYKTSSSGSALQLTQNGGYTINKVTVDGAHFTATSTPDAVTLNAVIIGQLSNVVAVAGSGRALYVNGCTYTLVTGGYFQSLSGATCVGTAGVCTLGQMDKEAYIYGGVSSVVNAGTGTPPFNIETRQSTVAGFGTWAVGDSIINYTPVSASPKGWLCVTAGTPGTWISVGNL